MKMEEESLYMLTKVCHMQNDVITQNRSKRKKVTMNTPKLGFVNTVDLLPISATEFC